MTHDETSPSVDSRAERFFDLWRELRRGPTVRRTMPLFFDGADGKITTGEADVLQILFAREAKLPLGALAERAGMDTGNMSRLVEQMAQRGLVQRTTDPDNSRIRIVSLSAEGSRVAESHCYLRQKIFNKATDHLNGLEKEKFIQTLQQIIDEIGSQK